MQLQSEHQREIRATAQLIDAMVTRYAGYTNSDWLFCAGLRSSLGVSQPASERWETTRTGAVHCNHAMDHDCLVQALLANCGDFTAVEVLQ